MGRDGSQVVKCGLNRGGGRMGMEGNRSVKSEFNEMKGGVENGVTMEGFNLLCHRF